MTTSDLIRSLEDEGTCVCSEGKSSKWDERKQKRKTYQCSIVLIDVWWWCFIAYAFSHVWTCLICSSSSRFGTFFCYSSASNQIEQRMRTREKIDYRFCLRTGLTVECLSLIRIIPFAHPHPRYATVSFVELDAIDHANLIYAFQSTCLDTMNEVHSIGRVPLPVNEWEKYLFQCDAKLRGWDETRREETRRNAMKEAILQTHWAPLDNCHMALFSGDRFSARTTLTLE